MTLLALVFTLDLVAATLWLAIPLAVAAIGALICERGGLSYLVIAASMIAAAAATVAVAQAGGSVALGLLIGTAAGVAVNGLYAVATVYLHLHHHLSAVALTAIALGLVRDLPTLLFPAAMAREPLLYLGLVLLALGSWFLRYSKPGLQLRAAGDYPAALHAAGVSVARLRFLALIGGGLCAGLAAATISAGGGFTLLAANLAAIANPGAAVLIAGRAFTAIAVVIAGGRRPWGIAATALAVGFIEALALQVQRHLPLNLSGAPALPAELFHAVPYLTVLILLAAFGHLSRAPRETDER